MGKKSLCYRRSLVHRDRFTIESPINLVPRSLSGNHLQVERKFFMPRLEPHQHANGHDVHLDAEEFATDHQRPLVSRQVSQRHNRRVSGSSRCARTFWLLKSGSCAIYLQFRIGAHAAEVVGITLEVIEQSVNPGSHRTRRFLRGVRVVFDDYSIFDSVSTERSQPFGSLLTAEWLDRIQDALGQGVGAAAAASILIVSH